MYEEEVIDKWVGKIVKMVSPLNNYIEVGEIGLCVGTTCDCDGEIYLDVVWDLGKQTSCLEFRHEMLP